MKISGSSGSGGDGGINTDPPKGILKTANNNELFVTYIKDLEDSFKNISQLKTSGTVNYEEFSSKKLSADRLEVLDVTLQGILNDLEGIEDLMFVENQLKNYSEAVVKLYDPENNNNPCETFVDFFKKCLTMVKEKITIKEEQLLKNESDLPVFKVSDFPVNEKQKNANIQLKMVALGQGVRILKTPIDDPSIKITNPRAVAWFGYRNQPRKGGRYFASLLTYTPRKLSTPTVEALQNCITDKNPAKTVKHQGAGWDHAAKTGSSKGMQADNKITSNTTDTDAADFPGTDSKTGLPSEDAATVQTAKEEQPELLTKDSEKDPQSPVPKEKEPLIHREQASLSNNFNLMGLLHNQNPAQTRPTVTPEKPIKDSKPASPKNPTLEEFLEELEALLDETKELSSGTAEAITAASEKTQGSELLRKLKKLKLARFIQQQLARKDPCNAEKIIHQRLEKIKALHKSLQSTKLETNDVNEALTWLRDTVKSLTEAEKEAAEKCAKFQFQRTFGTINS